MSPAPPEARLDGRGPGSARGFIRGSSLFFVGRLISVVVNFLVQVLAVRYLTKSDYGAFAWAQSIAAMGASAILLGLNRGVAQFAAMHHERREYGPMFGSLVLAFGTVAGLGLAVVTLVLGLRGTIAGHVDGELQLGLLLLLIGLVPLDALDAMFETVMAVFAKARAIFFRRYLLAPLSKLVAVLLVMMLAGSVQALAAAYLAASVLGVAVYVVILWKVLAQQGLTAELARARLQLPVRALFGFSLPVMSTDLLMAVETPMVVILLERFRGTEHVAELKNALQVAGLCLIVFQNSKILFKPFASRLRARGDDAALGDLYWRSAAWIAVVTFPIFATCLFLAEPVMVLLWGAKYAGTGPLLAILALGKYANAALGMNTFTLQVHARVRMIFLINVASAASVVGLCAWLIPPYGVVGAAVAASLAVVLRNAANQIALATTTNVGLFPRHARRLYGSIFGAVLALALLHELSASPLVLAPAIAAAALFLPRYNRRYLDIAATFPELARVPLVGRYLGVHALGSARGG
jgi:O-antigen/teichoic acid export membrane protein